VTRNGYRDAAKPQDSVRGPAEMNVTRGRDAFVERPSDPRRKNIGSI
jgi:hypothetical protein